MTTAIAEQDPKAQELQAQVAQLVPIPVVDADSYGAAGIRWKAIVAMEKEVNAFWDPLVDQAHKTHKALTAKRAEFLDPLGKAKTEQTRLMKAWAQEEERKRLELERLAQERARKEAEDKALAEAAELEKAGFKEAAEQTLAAPPPPPQIVQPKAVPKGFGSAIKTTWKAQVTDMKAFVEAVAAGRIPMGAVLPNQVLLNDQARMLKKELTWPGVRVWEE
jgi:hypothetical protein